jgi:hypothetical protein
MRYDVPNESSQIRFMLLRSFFVLSLLMCLSGAGCTPVEAPGENASTAPAIQKATVEAEKESGEDEVPAPVVREVSPEPVAAPAAAASAAATVTAPTPSTSEPAPKSADDLAEEYEEGILYPDESGSEEYVEEEEEYYEDDEYYEDEEYYDDYYYDEY